MGRELKLSHTVYRSCLALKDILYICMLYKLASSARVILWFFPKLDECSARQQSHK